jgi:hypothetical protein
MCGFVSIAAGCCKIATWLYWRYILVKPLLILRKTICNKALFGNIPGNKLEHKTPRPQNPSLCRILATRDFGD